MSECSGLLGRLLGHSFVRAYDKTPPASVKFNGFLLFPDDQIKMVETLTARTFRGMYCVRCGAEVAAKNDEVSQ